jgi:hypothetical protein
MKHFQSFASAAYWKHYDRLPIDIQRTADKQFAIFQDNPFHPSLQLKPVGIFWSVRVTQSYRALALRREDRFYWFWIGSHDDYSRLISA